MILVAQVNVQQGEWYNIAREHQTVKVVSISKAKSPVSDRIRTQLVQSLYYDGSTWKYRIDSLPNTAGWEPTDSPV